MFFITFSNLWSFSFFFFTSYLILITSVVAYLTPVLNTFARHTNSKSKTYFSFVNSPDLLYVVGTPVVLIVTLLLLWTAPSFTAWFGHIAFTAFQLKITFFTLANFLLYLIIFTSVNYFSSREIYDYTIVTFNFLYWIILLFYANTIFTVIFVIEVIGALLFLLVITSTFSTAFFYRNLNLNYGHLFQSSTPYSYLQSVLYLFWISLISSLNLFIFVLFLYLRLLTFDWYLLEHVFLYFINANSFKEIFALSFSWFMILFCVFVKCGVTPLYIWKPTFFKGIPLYTLFFYITFFYFHFYLFIINFLVVYLSEIFYFYLAVFWLFILSGLVMLIMVICESYYLKVFLAISSILNSILVFLTLTSPHFIDTLFVM